jgi:quinol monooxygenase YgiN
MACVKSPRGFFSAYFMVLPFNMFLSIIKIYPRPGTEHTVIDVLDAMKVSIAASGDCLGCSVFVEQGEEGGVCYLEQWRNREALERQLRSPLFNRVLEMMSFPVPCRRWPFMRFPASVGWS